MPTLYMRRVNLKDSLSDTEVVAYWKFIYYFGGFALLTLFTLVSSTVVQAWPPLQEGFIATVAGNGLAGFSGDGGPATDASLQFPFGAVGVDGAGNIFIPDSGNNRIRRVDAVTGIITTAVGTSANLNFPTKVVVDTDGNLFIADLSNHRILRVDAVTGVITTVAGNGSTSFNGDGGPATDASLDSPEGIALDTDGNLFIADQGHDRVRRVDAVTGIITTVAGNGTFGFSGDGGPAINASLRFPTDVALDANGNLFIADLRNDRIRRVDGATGIIATVAGNGIAGFSGDGGSATDASLKFPVGVTLDRVHNIFIADSGNQRVRRVDAVTGVITTVAGSGAFGFSGDGGPAINASFANPFGVVVDRFGNLFISDVDNNRIRRVFLGGVDSEGPIISNVEAIPNPVAVNNGITLTARVDDSATGGSNILSAEFNVDGGSFVSMSANDGTFDEVMEDVTALIPAFQSAGIHTICVQGTDAAGNVGEPEYILLAVYDPQGGFVTGGGWINSPAGAYVPNPSLTGRANFGFVSKYKQGATVPSGQTEFHFKVADLNFHSTNYQWLVVSGPQAKFKGTGTINGGGNYTFQVSATDGQVNGGGGVDKFRIKIQDATGGIYDNQMGATDNANPTTALGGGNIVIHSGGTAKPLVEQGLPTAYVLLSNTPNPFNPATEIRYELLKAAHVQLVIYNLLGQEMVRLVDAQHEPGRYVVTWDGRNASGQAVASGVYLYRLTTSTGFSQTRRMTLVK